MVLSVGTMLAGFASLSLRPGARLGEDRAAAAAACAEAPGSKRQDGRSERRDGDSAGEMDPLFHEVRTTVDLQSAAAEVLQVALDVAQWRDFMPCCSHSELLQDVGGGRRLFRVRFGLSIKSVFIGDDVIYEVYQPAPDQIALRSTNNESLIYVDSIKYLLFVKDLAEGSELTICLQFRARNQFYLTMWRQIEYHLINMIAARLKLRSASLVNASSEGGGFQVAAPVAQRCIECQECQAAAILRAGEAEPTGRDGGAPCARQRS